MTQDGRYVDNTYEKMLKKRRIILKKNRFAWSETKETLKNNSEGGTLVEKTIRQSG